LPQEASGPDQQQEEESMKPVMKWIAAASLLMSGAAQAEPVTLDIWTIDRPDQYMYLLKDEFEQSLPRHGQRSGARHRNR
jgi:hypothetical protein